MMRWMLPFTASFIRNQIHYHERYLPSIIYLQKSESEFFNELTGQISTYNPLDTSSVSSWIYSKTRYISPAVEKRIINEVLKVQPDVIHVHYGVDCILFSNILRKIKVPVCVSFYGYDCTSFPKRYWNLGKFLIQKKVFHNPSVVQIFAMSEDMKEDLLSLGCPEDKIKVHYYGTETEPFQIQRNGTVKNDTRFLIVSGLHAKKGHLFLLDAFHRLNSETSRSIHLDIVGDGPMKDSIEKRILELNLKNVTLHGPVVYRSNQHIDFLKKADIFVHPSITPGDSDKEGIPGAVVEAMAAGLPVVSTNHAGIPFIIDHDITGCLVSENDVGNLVKVMQHLSEDELYRKRIGENGKLFALNELDVKSKEKELENLYDQAIEQFKLRNE